jgi:hypothetical protein
LATLWSSDWPTFESNYSFPLPVRVPIGNISPVKYEAAYYKRANGQAKAD